MRSDDKDEGISTHGRCVVPVVPGSDDDDVAHHHGSGLSAGAIVAIVLGSVAGAAAVVYLVYYAVCLKRECGALLLCVPVLCLTDQLSPPTARYRELADAAQYTEMNSLGDSLMYCDGGDGVRGWGNLGGAQPGAGLGTVVEAGGAEDGEAWDAASERTV
jgi:hypothetical protein